MANVFSGFRKNQKKLLAFLGVTCMVTFVIMSPGVELSCGGPQGEAYAVHAKGASLSQQELQQLVQRRSNLNQFANTLERERYLAADQEWRKNGAKKNEPRPQFQQHSFGSDSPIEAFNLWLRLRKANDLGLSVDQATVLRFIKERSSDALSPKEMDEFLKQTGMTLAQLYDGLKDELRAARVGDAYGFGQTWRVQVYDGNMAITPAAHKEFFDRLHRRAHLQVVAIPVADFASQVAEPDEKTLRKFYDDRRDNFDDPEQPNPGFKLPTLSQFQYLKVSQTLLQEAAMKAITAAEIEKRYDEDKTKAKENPHSDLRFDEREWKDSLKATETTKKDDAKKDDGKTDDGKKNDAKEKDAKAGTETPSPKSDAKASGSEKGGSTPPKTDAPKADAKAGASGAAASPARKDRQAGLIRALPISFAADGDASEATGVLLAQADPKTADAKTSSAKTDAVKTDPAKTDPAKTDAAKTDAGKTDAGKTDAGKTDSAKTDAKTSAPADGKSPDAGKSAPVLPAAGESFKLPSRTLDDVRNDLKIPEDIAGEIAGGRKVEFKPLSQVEGKIRETLAKEMAARDAKRLADSLKESLAPTAKAYEEWSRKAKKDAPPLNPLDDETKARAMVRTAWDQLTAEKKAAWKKSFEDRKVFVDAEIKGQLAGKKLTLEGLKKVAADGDDEALKQRLKEHEQLADVEKYATATLEAWTKPLQDKVFPAAKSATDAKPASDSKSGEAEKKAVAKEGVAKDATAKDASAKKAETPAFVVTLVKTGRGQRIDRLPDGQPVEKELAGLDARAFMRSKDSLALSHVANGERVESFMNVAFSSPKEFQPQIATSTDDQFVFWKIGGRNQSVMQWDAPATADLPATKDLALERYREQMAETEAMKFAQQWADEINREASQAPTAEVQRLFRLDVEGGSASPAELTALDRSSLAFSGEKSPLYAVVAETLEDGKPRKLPGSAVAEGPVEAPQTELGAPGSPRLLFSDLAKARQYAQQWLAELCKSPELREAQLRVIIGRSIGEGNGHLIFQGEEAYRWDSAADNALSMLGQLVTLAPHMKKVGPGHEAKPFVGRRLEPFSWNAARPLVAARDEPPRIAGLDLPSDELCETAFKLAPGEVAVALNYPRTVAYLVQLISYDYQLGDSVYPGDLSLAKNPVRQAIIMAAKFPPRQGQPNQQELDQFTFNRAYREYMDWQDALYKEYGVDEKDLAKLKSVQR